MILEVDVSDFSAAESALGYLYQARYALLLLIDGPEEHQLVLEKLDDIVLEDCGTPAELLQAKYHTSHAANLTDSSADLWKTLRIWSTHLKNELIKIPPTALTLITTAMAPGGSIASNLRPGSHRTCTAALHQLRQIAEDSKNVKLKSAFEAFTALSGAQQEALVNAISVLDSSPDIGDVQAKIKERIRAAVDRQNRDALYERLEGWWFGKVVDQLRSTNPTPITGFEVNDKLRMIAEQFIPAALPIDYLGAEPEDLRPGSDDRMFVRQLRTIDAGLTRIEKAILDFYRAFEQRSRWAREELLVGDEVEVYEARLIDEWQRYAAALTELFDATTTEIELKNAGRQIFAWVEQTADLRIRPNVGERYVMRGSYHLLANQIKPRVWWHPRFLDRLTETVGTMAGTSS
jgi:hypothetical protein